ncbi:MAG: AAA-like domain-containing protein [Cyanobacteriota bacterium]
MSRSLKVRSDCINQAKLAIQRNGFRSQRAFAEDLGLALSTVGRFLNGKTVDYATFVEICGQLELDWRAIADVGDRLPPQPVEVKPSPTIANRHQHWGEAPDASFFFGCSDELSTLEQWIVQDKGLPKAERRELPFPEGSVALDSSFYVERPGIESLCYETIVKPGSLIRVKAPKMMGKTSLMTRILAHAANRNYQTVYLDLSSVERGILTNLDKFLRWLCLMVGRQLRLENQLNDYWDTEILGSNDNCTVYFEEYLLTQIDCPVVLGLDEVDRLFPYTEVIEDFLGMLRSWHEKGKISEIWKQLRLVMAHSTEVYIPLDMNQSPFNAGVPVELLEFDKNQIQDLVCLHNLNWNDTQVEELMRMIGGHPYLVRLAMYKVSSLKVTLEQLLQEAATEAGIYSNHLRRHLETLQKCPELALALKKVVTLPEPIELDSMQIYKLHSMGLVQRQNNYVMPRCNLYREYFRRVLV